MLKNNGIKIAIMVILTFTAINFTATISALTIGNTVTEGDYVYDEIVEEVFNNPDDSSDREYVPTGKLMLVEYTGNEENVVVPAKFDDKPVVELGNYVFYENSNIKTITLPDTLKTIASSAFCSCENLTTINIPEGIEFVDSSFIRDCPSNVKYTLPSDLELLGKHLNLFYVKASTVTLSGKYYYDYANEVIRLVNEVRAENDLYAYEIDDEIMSLAITRAPELAIYLGHDRPNGLSIQSLLEFQYRPCSEIIGGGQKTPEEIVNRWLNSQYHRPTIMSSQYKVCGAACYYIDGNFYWIFAATSKNLESHDNEYSGIKSESVDVKISKYHDFAKLWGIRDLTNDDKILKSPKEMKVGDTFQVDKILTENKGWTLGSVFLNQKDVKWNSSNTKVFTVNNSGKITAVGGGEATLTVSLGNSALEYTVKVDGPAYVDPDPIIPDDPKPDENKKGDMNKDGKVNATDAAMVLDRYKYKKATDEDMKIGDMNNDKKLNATDAALILDIYKSQKN